MESSFASRIKQFRNEKQLSQTVFGERCGLTQGNVAHMEGGKEPLQSNVAKLIAGFPDLNPDWLLLGTGPMLRDGRVLTPVVVTEATPAVVAPTPGLTSGAATVAEAENVLLREQVKRLTEMLEWVKNLVPGVLGKMFSSPDAAYAHQSPLGALVGA